MSYVAHYNHERPHSACGGYPPIWRYDCSRARKMQGLASPCDSQSAKAGAGRSHGEQYGTAIKAKEALQVRAELQRRSTFVLITTLPVDRYDATALQREYKE